MVARACRIPARRTTPACLPQAQIAQMQIAVTAADETCRRRHRSRRRGIADPPHRVAPGEHPRLGQTRRPAERTLPWAIAAISGRRPRIGGKDRCQAATASAIWSSKAGGRPLAAARHRGNRLPARGPCGRPNRVLRRRHRSRATLWLANDGRDIAIQTGCGRRIQRQFPLAVSGVDP